MGLCGSTIDHPSQHVCMISSLGWDWFNGACSCSVESALGKISSPSVAVEKVRSVAAGPVVEGTCGLQDFQGPRKALTPFDKEEV
ncbi:hypothetical protein J1614_007591 [Plenodomus biglobosus]|nr:hypothetical protein J1614_007591 [Plenodomus biglobosus]